ncbi:unnamed protein product [Schistocephalus solidus]|uniref:Histone H1-like n=1 Tax=Schistocephalus solidus TaxID=70667 RepID=A0A0X3PE51_SCHSO|nr:unnamed protein product [Schistocephalus solidus]
MAEQQFRENNNAEMSGTGPALDAQKKEVKKVVPAVIKAMRKKIRERHASMKKKAAQKLLRRKLAHAAKPSVASKKALVLRRKAAKTGKMAIKGSRIAVKALKTKSCAVSKMRLIKGSNNAASVKPGPSKARASMKKVAKKAIKINKKSKSPSPAHLKKRSLSLKRK